MGAELFFNGQIYETPVAYNSAILGSMFPDAPPSYQAASIADLADLPAPSSVPVPVVTSAGGGSKIAPDSWANGICDRCGFSWILSELRFQVYNREFLGIRVCPNCYDEDNPQLWIGEVDVNDSSVLRDPRPDSGDRINGRGIVGWNPVVLNMPLACALNASGVTIT